VIQRRGVRFLTLDGEVGPNGELGVSWPIRSGAASLAAIQALLGHPALVSGDNGGMRRLGVIELRRAGRISNGKFMNFTRAEVA
jgi:hypothetical protein